MSQLGVERQISHITGCLSRYACHSPLVALPLVLFAPIVFGGRVLYWGVPLMQFYPWQRLAVESWRTGQVPLWNPLVGGGAPLAANLQTGVFYPLNALYLVLPTESAMGYTAVLHVILAGLFMFACMRSFGLRPLPSLVASIAFQLSGFFIARLGFLSMTATFPWLAAWLWRGERVARSGHVRDGLWLALVVGMGLLAGHAQTALYGLIFLSAYLAIRVLPAALQARRVQRSTRAIRLQFAASAGGLLLGVALAAIQLAPTAELSRESQRVGGLDYTFAMTHSYWPWRLVTLLTPDMFGNPAYGTFWGYDNYWENAAYVGLIPLALAAMAVQGEWRRRLTRTKDGGPGERASLATADFHTSTMFFAVAALLALILALGWFTPIFPFLFRVVPGLSLFQGPARWLCVFTLALCALAGIGAEAMLRQPGSLRQSAKWMLVGLALIGAAVAARGFLLGRTATFADSTLRLGVMTAAAGLLFGLRPPGGDRRFSLWSAAFVAVIAIDLLTAHAALNPTIDASLYRAPTQAAAAIQEGGGGRVYVFEEDDAAVRRQFGIVVPFADFGPAEVDYWRQFRETLIPNTSMIDGVAASGNFDSLLVSRALQLREAIESQPLKVALRALSLMSVRYIVSPRTLDLPVVRRSQFATLYRNDAALPRAWIVPSARVESEPLTAILHPGFDARQVVILETQPDSPGGPEYPGSIEGFALSFLRDTPNAVTIRAASERDGYLVLADTWYTGWRATLDGQPTVLWRANFSFRAVAIPAGEHVVEFRYEPDSFRFGASVTLVSALVLVAGLALTARRCR